MSEQQKLTAADGADTDYFGYSVDVDGDTAVIGAKWTDDAGQNSGSAYVYVRTGGSWAEQAVLSPSDADQFLYFGTSVAIDGDTIVVGVSMSDLTAINAGATYVYVRTGTMWVEEAVLQPLAAVAEDRFGTDVDLDGNLAIVGATGAGAKGGAFLFGRVGTSWIEGPFLENTSNSVVNLGTAVGISGTLAVLGDPEWDPFSQFSLAWGRVFVFERFGGRCLVIPTDDNI